MKLFISIVVLASGMLFNLFRNDRTSEKKIQRDTVEQLGPSKGIIRQLGNSNDFVIECDEKNLRLNPLNLPKEYQEADLPIIFSGDIKTTQPLEDDLGEFFVIKTIH